MRQATAERDCRWSTILSRYWLAGILEGEGTFLKGPPSSPRCPVVRLAMTDQDAVEHAARLLCRAVTPWDRKAERPRKRVYITSIKGAAAAKFMAVLYPVMGRERREQIDEAISAPHAERIRAVIGDTTCAVMGCIRRVRSRGLCLQHYRSWWKSVRYRRTPRYHPIEAALPPPLKGEPLIVALPEDPRSVAWLAGLLEGEGTFSSQSGYPRISVQMTDQDVVERAAAILGIRNVHLHEEKRNPEWLPTHVAALTGSRAAPWMRTLRPLMGERRGREIDRALAAYHPIRLMDPPDTCTIADCRAAHRSRGLCHKHYMSWSRDIARRAVSRLGVEVADRRVAITVAARAGQGCDHVARVRA